MVKWHCGANGMLVSAPLKIILRHISFRPATTIINIVTFAFAILDLHCSQWRHLHQVALNFRPVVYTMTHTQKIHHETTRSVRDSPKLPNHPPFLNLTLPLNFHWGPNICRIRGGVCGHFPRILHWFKQPIWLLTLPISSVHATVCWAGISRPSTHLLNKLLWMKITADELAQLLVIFSLV